MTKDFKIWTLSNGLKAMHKKINSPVAHCCMMIKTGTRHEAENENGLAHFIEHCLFKGTETKSAHTVLNKLDNLGGEINAYTTKEETCIYATFLISDFDAAMDLVADITFKATFPEKEIQREKTVIIDEIHAYRDSPSEEIFDRFEEILFPNHPLGRDILGTEESVNQFNSSDCKRFLRRNYSIENIIFASIGNISDTEVNRKLEKWFQKHIIDNELHTSRNRMPFEAQTQLQHVMEREVSQTHVIMGQRAYPLTDKRRTPLFLLNNILGGPAMNSLLNMAIREKNGYTYTIESNYSSYSDTGLWHVYYGSDNKSADKCMHLVIKELRKLMNTPLSANKLAQAKKQLLGQVAIARDNGNALMLSAAKNQLFLGHADDFDTLQSKIEIITTQELMEVANDIFNPDQMITLTFKSA